MAFMTVAFSIPIAEEREFARFFLLWEKLPRTTLKKYFSSDTSTGGVSSISSLITQESTFGAGIKLPLETLNSSEGLA